jgi:RNA polymerase sigma-70 factor, ECF subfamily
MAENVETLVSFREGDMEAFAGIMRRFQSPIIHYLYHLTGDSEVARDLAQDTFLQAFKSLPKTTRNLPLKNWLYRIATNNAIGYYRHKAILSFIPWEDNGRPHIDGDSLQQVAEVADVRAALMKLPAKLRVCLVLHLVDGFKHREIAHMLGVSEDAVRKRVTRAMEKFRQIYPSPGGNS